MRFALDLLDSVAQESSADVAAMAQRAVEVGDVAILDRLDRKDPAVAKALEEAFQRITRGEFMTGPWIHGLLALGREPDFLTPERLRELATAPLAMPATSDPGGPYRYSPLVMLAAADEAAAMALVAPLQAAGFDPNAALSTPRRATLLHYAAAAGKRGLVDALLGIGAEPTVTDCRGDTAAEYADAGGHGVLAERLRHLAGETVAAMCPLPVRTTAAGEGLPSKDVSMAVSNVPDLPVAGGPAEVPVVPESIPVVTPKPAPAAFANDSLSLFDRMEAAQASALAKIKPRTSNAAAKAAKNDGDIDSDIPGFDEPATKAASRVRP